MWTSCKISIETRVELRCSKHKLSEQQPDLWRCCNTSSNYLWFVQVSQQLLIRDTYWQIDQLFFAHRENTINMIKKPCRRNKTYPWRGAKLKSPIRSGRSRAYDCIVGVKVVWKSKHLRKVLSVSSFFDEKRSFADKQDDNIHWLTHTCFSIW